MQTWKVQSSATWRNRKPGGRTQALSQVWLGMNWFSTLRFPHISVRNWVDERFYERTCCHWSGWDHRPHWNIFKMSIAAAKLLELSAHCVEVCRIKSKPPRELLREPSGNHWGNKPDRLVTSRWWKRATIAGCPSNADTRRGALQLREMMSSNC